MRLLLDCTSLSAGGGVQVGLSIIQNLARTPGIQACVVGSNKIVSQLPEGTKCLLAEFHIFESSGVFGKLRCIRRLREIESLFLPDIVFTVFGPAYWRSRATNVQGFALGKMLYPEVRAHYSSKFARVKEAGLDRVKTWFLRRNADYFMVETEVVKERLVGLLGMTSDRVFVVENSYSPAFQERWIELERGQSQDKDKFAFAACGVSKSERIKARPSAEMARSFRDDIQRYSRFQIFVPASFYLHKNLGVVAHAARALSEAGRTNFEFLFTLESGSRSWRELKRIAGEAGGEVNHHRWCGS